MASPSQVPLLRPINLTDLSPVQLTRLLVTPLPQLLIDCEGPLLPHPLGVCRYVSLLLQLRRLGTDIWLCNVRPELRRYLHELQLGPMFHFAEPALPTEATPPAAELATHA